METIEILKGLKSRFEEHHGIKYSAAAPVERRRAVGPLHQRPPPARQGDRRHRRSRRRPAHPAQVAPEEAHRQDRRSRRSSPRSPASRRATSPTTTRPLKTLDRDLKNVVFGQDAAIEGPRQGHQDVPRLGLGNPHKPIGAFLFSGPTGVGGKTEVARQLAYTLGIELVRFDMSEYMERHAVSA